MLLCASSDSEGQCSAKPGLRMQLPFHRPHGCAASLLRMTRTARAPRQATQHTAHSTQHAALPGPRHPPSSLAPSCSISFQVALTLGTQAAAAPAAGVAAYVTPFAKEPES
jgi:hypothetical protein